MDAPKILILNSSSAQMIDAWLQEGRDPTDNLYNFKLPLTEAGSIVQYYVDYVRNFFLMNATVNCREWEAIDFFALGIRITDFGVSTQKAVPMTKGQEKLTLEQCTRDQAKEERSCQLKPSTASEKLADTL